MTDLDPYRDDQFIYKILRLKRDQLKESYFFTNTSNFDYLAEKVCYRDFIKPYEEKIQNLEAEVEILRSLLTVKTEKTKEEVDVEIEKKVEKLLEEPRALMLHTMEKTMKMMEQYGHLEAAHKELKEKVETMEGQHTEAKEQTLKMIDTLEAEIRTILEMEGGSENDEEDEVEHDSDEDEEDENELNESQQRGLDESVDTVDEVEDAEQQASDEVEDEVERPPATQSTTETHSSNSRRPVSPMTARPQQVRSPPNNPPGAYPFGSTFAQRNPFSPQQASPPGPFGSFGSSITSVHPSNPYPGSQYPFPQLLVPGAIGTAPTPMMSPAQQAFERQRAIEHQAQMMDQQRRRWQMVQQQQAMMQPMMATRPDSILVYQNGVPSFVPLRNSVFPQ